MPHAPGPPVQCVGCVAHPLGVATATRHRTSVLGLRRGPCFGKLMFLSFCVKTLFQKNLSIINRRFHWRVGDPHVFGKKVSPHLSGCCTKDFNIGFLDIASASVRNFELRLACYIEGACGIMLLSDVHSDLNSAGLRHCLEAAMHVAAVCQKTAPG